MYDAAGNLAHITSGSLDTSLTTDADNRLVAASASGITTTYANDAFGRRSARTGPAGTTTYTWSTSGKLTAIASPDATATYAYGATGMREVKSAASASGTRTTSSYYSGMQITAERDSDGTYYRYLYGPGGVPLQLSVTASGSAGALSYAYVTDHAGSVIGLTDSAGTLVASYSYDPWGNPTSTGGTNPALAARQPLRFRGYYWDSESALYYMPARFYDPAVGRFLSVDPAAPSAGNPLSLNPYAYCEDDPIRGSDPTGAVADYDGTGKATVVNTGMQAATNATGVRAGYYRNRAMRKHYEAAARTDGFIARWRAEYYADQEAIQRDQWQANVREARRGAEIAAEGRASAPNDLVARMAGGINENGMERMRSGDMQPAAMSLLSGGNLTGIVLAGGGAAMMGYGLYLAGGGTVGLATVVGAPVGAGAIALGVGLFAAGALTTYVGVQCIRIQAGA